MALTDNSATPEEVSAAIAANPAFLEVIKSAIPADKFVLTPKEEFDKLEGVHIGKYVSTTAPLVEKTIKDLTGIEKTDANEKWTDYLGRAVGQVSTGFKTATQELKTLKESTDLTSAERDRMKVLEELVKTTSEEKDSLITKHEAEVNTLKTGNSIINDISPVRSTFIKDPKLTKAIEVMHSATLAKLQGMARVEPTTGKTIFFGADGKVILDDKGNFATGKLLYEKEMVDFIDAGAKRIGANGEKIDEVLEGVPAGVKTQVELSKHISAQGILAGTPEYTAKWKEYKGASLPRN